MTMTFIETALPVLSDMTATPVSIELIASPTQFDASPTATTTPALLPVFAPMESGAPGWIGSEAWMLNDAARYGDTGQGWSVLASDLPYSTLDWTQAIDLRTSQSPRLRFASQMRSLKPSVRVQVSIDGVNWQFLGIATSSSEWTETVMDLSAYRDQVIYVQWVWLSPVDDLCLLDDR